MRKWGEGAGPESKTPATSRKTPTCTKPPYEGTPTLGSRPKPGSLHWFGGSSRCHADLAKLRLVSSEDKIVAAEMGPEAGELDLPSAAAVPRGLRVLPG